jgi:glycosyltransferase involved in cell wall biosynthesis
VRTDTDGSPSRSAASLPRVSVVIPTRNRVELLRTTLASVLSQTEPAVEVIVVDDESSDQTAPFLAAAAAADGRVRAVPGRARGAGGARGTGLELARAPWVAFIDDDDLWHPDALALLLAAARGDELAVAGHAARFSSADPAVSWSAIAAEPDRYDLCVWPPVTVPDRVTLGDLLLANRFPIHTVLAAREAVLQAGGFDPRWHAAEDYDLWLRLARSGPISVIPQTVAYIRQHGGQTSGNQWLHSRETRRVIEAFLAAERLAGRNPMPDMARRRRLAGLHREEAYEALQAGQRGAVARSALAGLRLWPFELKCLAYLLAAPLPPRRHPGPGAPTG